MLDLGFPSLSLISSKFNISLSQAEYLKDLVDYNEEEFNSKITLNKYPIFMETAFGYEIKDKFFNTSYIYFGEMWYEKSFCNNKPHGYGIKIYSTFEYYQGFWKNGMRNGLGKTMYKQNKLVGYFENDILEGEAKIYYGSSYEYEIWQFKNNNKHGTCEYFDNFQLIHIQREYSNGILIDPKEVK